MGLRKNAQKLKHREKQRHVLDKLLYLPLVAATVAAVCSAFFEKPVKPNAFSNRAPLQAMRADSILEQKIKEMYRKEYETCGPGGFYDAVNEFFKAKERGDEKSAKRLYKVVHEMEKDRLQRQSDCEFMRRTRSPFLKHSGK